jgi:hypothetical protein
MKKLFCMLFVIGVLIPSYASAGYYGSWKIDDTVTIVADTHLASTGAVTDADSVPAYRVYEDKTVETAILTGSMSKHDDSNTTGHYSVELTLSAANGFEKGKSYHILVTAAVSSKTGAISHWFQIEAEVDANSGCAGGSITDCNIVSIGGSTTSATDFKDLIDNCYIPSTNSISLVDTTTTNTDMRGTDSASTFDPTTENVTVGTIVATVKNDINAEVDTAFSDYDPPTQTELLAAHSTTDNLLGTIEDHIINTGNTDWATFGGSSVIDANIVSIGGSGQSATDLKDFADAGYDPATNKVQGVVLVDTTTTNTDMVTMIDANVVSIGGSTQSATDFKDMVDNSYIPSTNVLNVDVKRIDGELDAADLLELSASIIVSGQASAGTLSTTQMTTNLTESTDDHYIGRIICWETGVLAGQCTDITDYTGATKLFTYTAVTEPPAAGNKFTIH